MRTKRYHYAERQTGSILLMALVFLALTSMIAMTIMDTSILENRMAANQQLRQEAMQHTEGVLRSIVAQYDDANNPTLPVGLPYQAVYCPVVDQDPECAKYTLYINERLEQTIPSDVDIVYRARRLHTQRGVANQEEYASSGQVYHFIEVSAEYIGLNAGLSNAELALGVKISQFLPGTRQFVESAQGSWILY